MLSTILKVQRKTNNNKNPLANNYSFCETLSNELVVWTIPDSFPTSL